MWRYRIDSRESVYMDKQVHTFATNFVLFHFLDSSSFSEYLIWKCCYWFTLERSAGIPKQTIGWFQRMSDLAIITYIVILYWLRWAKYQKNDLLTLSPTKTTLHSDRFHLLKIYNRWSYDIVGSLLTFCTHTFYSKLGNSGIKICVWRSICSGVRFIKIY